VLERYYNGASVTRLANIKSASKSVISTLVGIAIERKLIPDVKTPIVTWFPELAQRSRSAKRAITLEHLLAMRSGSRGRAAATTARG
jgi:CubicO group peptidase (beta-lactamase class C family)